MPRKLRQPKLRRAPLAEAIRLVLLTGELAPSGVPGRTDAFRLMYPSGERLEALRELWAEYGDELTAQWQAEHGPDAIPWAAEALMEADVEASTR